MANDLLVNDVMN